MGKTDLTQGSLRGMRLSHYRVVGIFGVTGREKSVHTWGLGCVFSVPVWNPPPQSPARPWAIGSGWGAGLMGGV